MAFDKMLWWGEAWHVEDWIRFWWHSGPRSVSNVYESKWQL